jgi:hypothetical protein
MTLAHGNLAGPLLGVEAFLIGATLLVLAGTWRAFQKAGRPGWAAVIPVYSLIVLSEIAGSRKRFLFSPFDVARAFGRSSGFGIGLAVLPFIFYPVLGFGSSCYVGPAEVPDYGLRWAPRSEAAVDPQAWTPPSQRQPTRAGTPSRNPLALLVSPLAVSVLIDVAILIGALAAVVPLADVFTRNPSGLPATQVTVKVGQRVGIDPAQVPEPVAASIKLAALAVPAVGSASRSAVAVVDVCSTQGAGAITQGSLGLFVLYMKDPTGRITGDSARATFASPLMRGQCQQGKVTWPLPDADTVLAIDYFESADQNYRWVP